MFYGMALDFIPPPQTSLYVVQMGNLFILMGTPKFYYIFVLQMKKLRLYSNLFHSWLKKNF